MVNQKEVDLIHRCYKRNYKGLECIECEMNYMCEAWKQRDGIAPLTLSHLNPEAPLNSNNMPEVTARRVA